MSQYLSPLQRRKKVEKTAKEFSTQEQFLTLIRANAGARSYARKDPVYALSESFSQVFDLVGRQGAQAAMGLPVEQTEMRGTDMLPYIADDNGQ